MTFSYQIGIFKYKINFLDIVITISQAVPTYRQVANEGKSEFR